MESLLCTIAETADLLRVSPDTIRRSISVGLIPVKRIRANVRISRAWLDSYVAESAPILLTRRQVSVKLGISARSVTTLQRKGLLPTVMVGALRRIPAVAVAEYLKRNTFAFLRPRKAPRTVQHSAVAVPVPVPVPSGQRLGFSSVAGV
jgi:excisionase family DNA binding protein